jgi:hypothetical protein
MRLAGWIVLAACGASPSTPAPRAPTPPDVPAPPERPTTIEEDDAAVDPIAVLAPDDANATAMIPARIQLEHGGASIETPGGNQLIDKVRVFAKQGGLVRVAVRLPHARFSVWTQPDALLSSIKRDQVVSQFAGGGGGFGDKQVTLKAGAPVQRLARKDKWSQIRYVGRMQVEGWVPDAALAELGQRRGMFGPIITNGVFVFKGTVLRTESKWGSRELAVVAQPQLRVELVQSVDRMWSEIRYSDLEVQVSAFINKQMREGRIAETRGPETPPPKVSTNELAPSGTCLHARIDGEAIDYIVGDQRVGLDDAGDGWWNLAVDTPWGPITFVARGSGKDTLAACAPDGSVPKPRPPSVP